MTNDFFILVRNESSSIQVLLFSDHRLTTTRYETGSSDKSFFNGRGRPPFHLHKM